MGKIQVGDDGITRRERDMGLIINKKTGRAYKSQGDFTNFQMHANGRFIDGKALPSAFRCAECGELVIANDWRQMYTNCSGVMIGHIKLAHEFHICPGCTLKVLKTLPNITGMVKAMHGGDLKRG